ncbi:nucleotidyltransferase family protein [Stigmatella sp. ncwal1]|uniref:Nucleotidyltransferase family protein n=1 Tax=Stigmatella ashevillensis TaxID=2995309 RepID=A0ABT5DI84_9BACT|nr:nucleotidyltransferase family protein [Stigmatella ashevillena]MDC0713367.1 nucleotidyltransferase family protein [Stigmatella ashevillena]
MGARAFLTLLRAWPEAPSGPLSGDAEALVRAAARHGLAGFTEHALAQAGWRLPEASRDTLRREARSSAARAIRVHALLLRSLEALGAEGVVPVLLKGYGLARRLYPEPFHRATTDVDLLVAPAQVAAAARALEGLGLVPVAEPPGHGGEHAHHRAFHGPAGLVELHFRALASGGQALEAEPLLAHAREFELEGHRVRYLRVEEELVYLALHASNHLLQRLTWLMDLKLLLRANPGLSWRRVVEVAQGTAFPHLAWYALEATHRLLGLAVPEEVLSALAPRRWQQGLAGRFFSEERLLSARLAAHKAEWLLAKLLLAPRVRPLARYVLWRLGETLPWKRPSPH